MAIHIVIAHATVGGKAIMQKLDSLIISAFGWMVRAGDKEQPRR
jgi:hypothetical protein